MKKSTMLRRRAREMTEMGEHGIAAQCAQRANTLEGRATPRRNRRMARVATPTVQNLPNEVLVFRKDGRMFIQPPSMLNDAGDELHWPKLKAMGAMLRDASTIDGEKHYKYEGRAYKPSDPRRSQWSFTISNALFSKIKRVLGDFFSEATLIDDQGQVLGTLPKSTYQG